MSQKKIDQRKQSKGDMLHQAKKQMKITVALVAVVLLAVGGIAAAFAYTGGYEKGHNVGYEEGYEVGILYQQYLDKLEASKTTTSADKDKETTSKDDAKEDETTKANSEDETTTAEKETEESKEDK